MNRSSLFSVSGKVAVVTGASQGIGSGMARFLAQEGAKTVLLARNGEKLNALHRELSEQGLASLPIPCDLTKLEEIRSAMEEAAAHFGTIDILVNNAGTNIPKPAEEVTEEDWDRTLDLNVKSAFFCCQEAGKYMRKQQYGKIINITSQMAFVGYFKRSAYCASKGGLTQLTRALAIEWAKDRINVNAIAPTFIETPLTEKMFADQEFKQDVLSRIPLGRLATEEDLYGALLFLSSRASDMVTGQTILVDGGWTVW